MEASLSKKQKVFLRSLYLAPIASALIMADSWSVCKIWDVSARYRPAYRQSMIKSLTYPTYHFL